MNLIEAYKKAGEGDILIAIDIPKRFTLTKKYSDLRDILEELDISEIINANWQIERRPLVWEAEGYWDLKSKDIP